MTKLADLVATKDAHELIIYGDKGSGKSFLMQAICNELGSSEKQFTFIPMHQAIKMGVEISPNLASLDAGGIDDLQIILADEEWELALFNLINECQPSHCTLILSIGGPNALADNTRLPDMLSRITSLASVRL